MQGIRRGIAATLVFFLVLATAGGLFLLADSLPVCSLNRLDDHKFTIFILAYSIMCDNNLQTEYSARSRPNEFMPNRKAPFLSLTPCKV